MVACCKMPAIKKPSAWRCREGKISAAMGFLERSALAETSSRCAQRLTRRICSGWIIGFQQTPMMSRPLSAS